MTTTAQPMGRPLVRAARRQGIAGARATRPTPQERAAHARWAARRRRLIGYGQWKPFTEAEPVRAHVRAIQASGMPLRTIAERAGVSPATLEYLLWGDRLRETSTLIRTESAQALLNYWPTLDDYPPHALIDATGSRRRVHALATRGWPISTLSLRAGVSGHTLKRALAGRRISVRLARTVRDLYNELWDQPAEQHGTLKWVADRTRRQAAAANWAPPLAWDDETIDDPKTRAKRGGSRPDGTPDYAKAIRALEGEPIPLTGPERTLAVRIGLAQRGMTYKEIATELDMAPDTVMRAWERIKERAARDGKPVPRRTPRDGEAEAA